MVLPRVGIVGVERVPIRTELTVDAEVGKTGQVEQRHRAEPLCDKIKVLVDLYGSDHLGTLIVPVTFHHVGVRVGVLSLVIVTEHDVFDANVLIVHRVVRREENRI